MAFAIAVVAGASIIGAAIDGLNESDRIESNERVALAREQTVRKKKTIKMKRKRTCTNGEVIEEEITLEYGDGDHDLAKNTLSLLGQQMTRGAIQN